MCAPGSDARRYGTTRSQVPLEPCQSPRPCIEEWAYTPEHLLKSHSVKDALTGETKKTVYRYNGGKMLIREDTTVQHGTSPAVAVASMKYEWDAYGNLRSAEDALTGAETEYEYDPRYHIAVYTAERASSSPGSPAGWRYTINVLDDTGQKTTSSSQSMQEPAWEAKPPRTVPVGCRLVDMGDAWESWTTGPAGAAQLVIDWVRGPFQAVGYDVSYRRRGDSQWIRVASLGHGWLSPTSGRDTVPIGFPEPGVYSIGVRMNSGILKGTYATIVSMTEQPYERAFPVPGSAKATVRYDYEDPGYPGNVTRRTVVQPGGQDEITSFAYDPAGHAYPVSVSTRVTAANGTESTVVVRAEYDSFGRATQYTTSAGASSSTTAFDYDEIGRLTKATYPDGTYATFYYDKDGRMTEARLFAAGGEPVCKTGSQYDARGRKTAEWWDVRGARYSIGYGYNKAGDVVRMTFPDGASVEYLYDGWGRLIAIPGLFGTGAFDPGFAYAQSGALSWIGRANGIPTTIAEDGRGRVDRITHGHGGQPVLDLDYEYDSVGNVVRINGREYTYDRLRRLVGYQRPTQSGTVEWVGYNYDLVGNRISESAGGVVGRTYSYNTGNYLSRTIDQTGQIESAFTYGSSGEQLTRTNGGVATNYVYDAAQRLTEASRDGAVIAGAVYDALGRRIVYTDSSGTVLTLYSGNDIVYERANRPEAPTEPGGPGTGEPGGGELIFPEGSAAESPPGLVRTATRYIVAHGKYLAKIVQEGASPAQTYFLHTDMLGSIRAITDSVGQVAARFDYEPFGLLIEESSPASAGGGEVHRKASGRRARPLLLRGQVL